MVYRGTFRRSCLFPPRSWLFNHTRLRLTELARTQRTLRVGYDYLAEMGQQVSSPSSAATDLRDDEQ
jgi:hypothetical protein